MFFRRKPQGPSQEFLSVKHHLDTETTLSPEQKAVILAFFVRSAVALDRAQIAVRAYLVPSEAERVIQELLQMGTLVVKASNGHNRYMLD